MPRVSMDYFFMGQEGERATEHPMILMHDEATGNQYMRAVNKKGLGDGTELEWLIKDMHEELKSWGHTGGAGGRLILKSDGEPSIKAVRDALGRFHGGQITPEQPPPGESQSNGRVEQAGKTIRGYVRVFKDMIEDKTGQKIPTGAIILQWLIRWAAMLHSRYSRGSDGRTAYERQRGRKCQLEVIPFGEKVHYKKLADDKRNKLECQWEPGIWLGHARGSNEVLVGTRNGVVRAWAIRRNTEEERWSATDIHDMQGTPARPNPNMPGHDVPILISIPAGDGQAQPEETRTPRTETEPRRTYLKARDFEAHGYTQGCEGCRRLQTGGMQARPHSAACRNRMEALLKQQGDPRYRRYQEQADQAVWEEVQRQEAEKAKRKGEEEKGQEEKNTEAEGQTREEEADTTEAGQAASSSGEAGRGQAATADGGAEKRGHNSEGEGLEESRGKRHREEEATGSKRRQEERGEESGDKRPKAEEAQGTKREGGEESEERQTVRRRLNRVQDAGQVDVAEIYSPPRVTTEAKKYQLRAGEAMDLTTGWNFDTKEDRARAEEYVRTQKPKLLVGSPMCTMFSQLQKFTPWTPDKQRKADRDRRHMQFVVKLYRIQAEEGRLFLHEHPAHATSWKIPEVERLQRQQGVYTVTGDQCMYGLATRGKGGRYTPARKSTKFMSNSYHITNELSRKCDRTHIHQPLVDGRAKGTEVYPPGLCKAICRGLIKERLRQAQQLSVVAEVQPSRRPGPNPNDYHENEEEEIRRLTDQRENAAYDDITGMPLDRKKVQDARREEIDYVHKKQVWEKITRAEAMRRGIKIIKTRWIDINKGDDQKPVYRSRFVAKEFNTGEVPGLFAGTPPLEAARYLVHEAATWDGTEKVMMINDVARAFFEAAAIRAVCIELPDEDKSDDDKAKDMVGILRMSLYGTRDAAKNWQNEVARMMKLWGFQQGSYNPCLYHHKEWDLRTLVHGDDFVSTGSRQSMAKFRAALEKRFKIKTQLVGTGGGEETKEARVLNRVLRVTEHGWEFEPDPRHTDMLIAGLGLQEAKPVNTPGEEEKRWENEENEEELAPAQAKAFRGYAARLNYMATDRPDIQYSTKEVCRHMAKPTVGAWKKLKRIVRYLVGARRTVLMYPWQGMEEVIETYSDSDWAGCKKTGRSTSGGAITIGEHFIKGWSSTQASITLSSAEAELVAMTKAVAETMGVGNMVRDLGRHMKGVVYADSSAALAIADRKGSGKLRHINIRMLWIQEQERKEAVETKKIKGEMNPADLLTKYLQSSRSEDHRRRLGQQKREGRAEAALEVKGKATGNPSAQQQGTLRSVGEPRPSQGKRPGAARQSRFRSEGMRHRRGVRDLRRRECMEEGRDRRGREDEEAVSEDGEQ